MYRVLIASAEADERAALEAQAALEALGYAVERATARPRDAKRAVAQSQRVVLLWSVQAARSPALRTLALRARADRKLTCVRVAREAPPALRGVRAAPWPRPQAWKALVETTMDNGVVERPRERTDRYGAVLTMLLLALAASTALYAVDAAFAARVNAITDAARGLVSGVIG